jgi:cytochrome P450
MSLILLTICLVLAAPLSLILYRAYCGITIYNRAVKAFGKDKVVFLNRPYQRHSSFFKESMADGIDSLALYTREIRKNPDIKLIVTALFESVYTIVCDPEMIRKITNEYSKNNVKRKFIVYSDAIERGLVFSEGETWKKSRSILSNLFHFEMLRSREAIMHKVVEEHIKDLAGK